jgi:adenine phosphoribosyltransferase
MELKSKIRVIEDFPKEGISFKDITTLLKDGEAFRETVDTIAGHLKEKNIDIIVGPEARGFILGAAVAYALGVAFVPVRKPGKLPAETRTYEYDLEYGVDQLEIHVDAIYEGARIAIVDDLLATGGTVSAVIKLIESLGGTVSQCEFLIELEELNGREKLKGYAVESFVKYPF